jgi:cell division protease FtsH
VTHGPPPRRKSEALVFALALKSTRRINETIPLSDAIYVERLTGLLPTFGLSPVVSDDLLFGYWLTGGMRVSVNSFRRLQQMTGWGSAKDLAEVLKAGGFPVRDRSCVPSRPRIESLDVAHAHDASESESGDRDLASEAQFCLPGRPELTQFFIEHVVDVVRDPERYGAFGIEFPGGVVLHGPPGTGKSYAVERLVEFLGWPSFHMDASTIASPFIHETSRKVSEVFQDAAELAPSVIVIDEMEAFLGQRDAGPGSHRTEEVAEFLRRIPDARKAQVLVIGMTNRIDMVDAAVLRRGRFDHLLEVGFASEAEITEMLDATLAGLPLHPDVDSEALAKKLSGRPLADVAFVVREGARMAARDGRGTLDQASLLKALGETPPRDPSHRASKAIGFT